MAIQCSQCRRQYDVTLFQFGASIICDCGAIVDIDKGHAHQEHAKERGQSIRRKTRRIEHELKRARMHTLQRMADRICSLILCSDYPLIDIDIEKSKVREKCEELFPDSMDLYDMIYDSRFHRLIRQFRSEI